MDHSASVDQGFPKRGISVNDQINISYLSFNFCRPPPLLVVHTGLHTTEKYQITPVQSWLGDLSSPLGVRVTEGVRELDVVPTVTVLRSTLV